MNKIKHFLSLFMAVVMTVSAFPMSIFAADNVITAVDTSGLVMETAWGYSGSISDTANRWSSTTYNEVASPAFYSTIPATVDGNSVDLPVSWTSSDYNSKQFGTYTFTAVADGYTWECDAPTIKVTVLDGAIGGTSTYYGYADGSAYGIDMVVKGAGTNKNQIYDATGCNKIYRNGTTAASKSTLSNKLIVIGGKKYDHTGEAGKTKFEGPTEGTINLTVTDSANITALVGANNRINHTGDVNVTVSNATVGTLYGGGRATALRSANVTGNVNIDVSGKVSLGTLCGGGVVVEGDVTADVSGTATVNVHDLTTGYTIKKIVRGTASKLVVKLDDTSEALKDIVVYDENTTIYINGVEYVPSADYSAVETALETVPEDLTIYTDTTAKAVTDAVNAVQYGLSILEQTTVDGYAETIETAVAGLELKITGVSLDKTEMTLAVGAISALTATVEPDGADSTIVWTTSAKGVATVDAGVVTAVGGGTATITATTVNGLTATCLVTVDAGAVLPKITAVDTEGLVTETLFPYTDVTNENDRWTSVAFNIIEEPEFCQTLDVTVDGEVKTVDVDWVSTDYICNVAGAYTFTAVAEGYEWECDAPTVTVKVVDGACGMIESGWVSYVTANGEELDLIVGGTDLYDKTGYNLLASGLTTTWILSGVNPAPAGNAGKTSPTQTDGVQKITVINGKGTAIVTGNKNIPHKGDRYVYINGYEGKYIAGGGFALSTEYTESGNTTLDITGKIVLSGENSGIYSGGFNYNKTSQVGNTEGTVTVNIFNLDSESSIPLIKRGNNKYSGEERPLVVNLDSTSEYLKDVVTYEANTTIYINGVEYVPAADYSAVETAKAKVEALDRTLYTEASLKVVDDAVAAVVEGLTINEQTTVDGFATAITTAISNLKLKPSKIQLSKESATLPAGSSFVLTATILPEGAEATVEFTSDNENVATFENGVVKAISIGTANIIAQAGELSATCVVTVESATAATTITAVDVSGLVMETSWAYSDSITNESNRWTQNVYNEVTSPEFYPTISATIKGRSVEVPVTWISDDYKSNEYGTYTFTAVADGYTWECDTPTIKVTVLDGAIGGSNAVYGYVDSSSQISFDMVIRSSGSKVNQIYDATGCNKLYRRYEAAAEDCTLSNKLEIISGKKYNNTGMTGKKLVEDTTYGNTNITITDNADIATVIGANDRIHHEGNVNIRISNATVGYVYGGGRSADGYDANVIGDANIDISGKVKIEKIYGGGKAATSYTSANLTGTTTVNIHNIESGSVIKSIVKGTADKLIINLDDTSAHLVDVIEPNSNLEVYINGVPYKLKTTYVEIVYLSGTQVVFARGVPIKIKGEGGEGVKPAKIPTYVWYFDENYDESETPETFSYPTYTYEDGTPIILTGVWRKISTPLDNSSDPVVYGGGQAGTENVYPSTYVEFNGGYIDAIYGGGKNEIKACSNLVLDAESAFSLDKIYGAGYINDESTLGDYVNDKTHILVKNGDYSSIYGGGRQISNNGTLIDITGGSVKKIYMGNYGSEGGTYGTMTLNIENCTVGNVYCCGYGEDSVSIGPAYVNVKENVTITGNIHPLGGVELSKEKFNGKLSTKAYITLTDSDKEVVRKQFNTISYEESQGSRICVNGVWLGSIPECTTASFETAEKIVEVTTDLSYTRANNTAVFLNGIPSVLAGDGNGHSYLYQAKTKDGTLNVYQKNEDGTFKLDENGRRISNIVRDPVTGQAIKWVKLLELDVADAHIYGGANGKSVEDAYIEIHTGGAAFNMYGGCRGGNAGYNAAGEEVGLVEIRMFGGAVHNRIYIGNLRGKNVAGNTTINTLCSKTVFIGVNGHSNALCLGGQEGVVGSKDKYIDGYYNRVGEAVTYEDPDDGRVYTITGTWEDYNLNIKKSDYTEYYEASNAYFNGSDSADFLSSAYYVDPYDCHYTTYGLIGNYMPQYIYTGTSVVEYDISANAVYGNQYLRHTAYGLKYDAELDMFVDDYHNYKGFDAMFVTDYAGSKTGAVYGDARIDMEGVHVRSSVATLAGESMGGKYFGHVYYNLYKEDSLLPQETYKKFTSHDLSNVTINQNFYPRWNPTAAWALDVDPVMAQLAIDRGYIKETTVAADVRTYMLSALDAAKLLNYYYTGTETYITHSNEQKTEGYKRIYDASDDMGKLTIRAIDPRTNSGMDRTRFTHYSASRPGDCVMITFPNGQIMVIDGASSSSTSYTNKAIKYYLKSAKEAGIGDGKTIDYLVLTHWHADHYGAIASMIKTFNVRNMIMPPFDMSQTAFRSVEKSVMNAIKNKNTQYADKGEAEINIIRPYRGYTMTVGEGEDAVEIFFLNPGDGTYMSWSYEKLKREMASEETSTILENAVSLAAKITYKGQSYIWAGDMTQDAERTLVATYGEEFLDCDVLDLSHHGYSSSNIPLWLNACDPEVVLQHLVTLGNPTLGHKYCEDNNTGGFAEEVYNDGRLGHAKVVLDGEKIVADTQLVPRAYERSSNEYKELKATYGSLVEEISDIRESLAVVADGATASYGTQYIWKSYADYIDGQLDELARRGYLANATGELLEDYNSKILELEQFINAATMTGGTDSTPDVEIPETEWSGTAGGTQGGIIVDIGGGTAGSGIGGPAGGVVGGETSASGTDDRRFIDVAATDWFDEAVNYVADNDFFNGVSEKKFDPSGKMTRAMLVTVIGRMAQADTSNVNNEFADVADGSWYAEFVAWAAENGIVTGVGDNKFAPDDNVTREQIAAILMRYAVYKGLETSVSDTEKYDSMKDTASVSEYAEDAMRWATACGVINGSDGNLNPKGTASRAEVAQMIMNFCKTFAI